MRAAPAIDLRRRAARARSRLVHEGAFTLMELLAVMIILANLLAIAVPSYVRLKDRATAAAAKSNVRAAYEGLQAYNADHAGTYTGVTLAKLQQSYDAGIKNVTVVSAGTTTYCIKSTSAGTVYYQKGPAGSITTTACT